MSTKKIPLTQGYEATVSEEDFGYLSKFKWTYSGGYAVRRRPGSNTGQILMHRLVMGVDGSPGFEIDHADMDKLNNTRENLRFVTRSRNIANKPSRGNRSGFKGVAPVKNSSTFCMEITLDGKRTRLSGFATAEDAARAYDAIALHLYGEFARVNFPDSIAMTLEELKAKYPARRHTSKHRGVSFHAKTGKWKATGPRETGRRFLGYFGTEEEAARAYDALLDSEGLMDKPRNFA